MGALKQPASVEFSEAPEAVDAQRPGQMGSTETPRAASGSNGTGTKSAVNAMLSDGISKGSAEDTSAGFGNLIEVCASSFSCWATF